VAKKFSNTLLTLSSAAILAVYAAGYERTRPAADRFAAQIAQRRAPVSVQAPVPTPQEPRVVLQATVAAAAPAPVISKKIAAPEPTKAAAPEIPAPAVEIDEPAQAEIRPAAEPDKKAIVPSQPAAATPQVVYKDGVYLGWGYSRHGNIQAFVRIEGGRIVHAGIERCQTRWSCDLVAHLPGQVIQRQSAEVDFVTGATDSGDAFYGGIFNALAQAK
jgi:uncharacterized protein with FMN-binding domain